MRRFLRAPVATADDMFSRHAFLPRTIWSGDVHVVHEGEVRHVLFVVKLVTSEIVLQDALELASVLVSLVSDGAMARRADQ